MQRDRGARENSNGLGSPFNSFDNFGFCGSMFGGKDPFNDAFFTHPLASLFGSNMSSSGIPGSLQHISRSKQLVIEELDSDAEDMLEDKEEHDVTDAVWSNRNPLVEHPEDQEEGNGSSNNSSRNEISRSTNDNKAEGMQPRPQNLSFQRVTYGGIDGAYYTATTSRQTQSNGMTLEESRQADRTTGQATHRVSRGIQDKGHSVTRKLDSDGKVDTMQTLQNLDEDELGSFEQAWRGRNLQGDAAWEGFSDPFNRISGTSHSQDQSSRGKHKKVVRINIE